MSGILDLLFPRVCYGCHRPGSYLCPRCSSLLTVQSFSPSQPDASLYGHLSLFAYKSSLKKLIHDLKYHFLSDSIEIIGQLIANSITSDFPHFLSDWKNNNYCLTPVPLHPLKRNWRGFNQSDLIAKNFTTKLGLKYTPDLLFRTHYTKPQVKQLKKSDRFSNVAGVFSVNPKYLLTLPKNIIIFDDVFTTGSTIKAAAKALKERGADTIIGLTLAG